jgi:hypothetical protein
MRSDLPYPEWAITVFEDEDDIEQLERNEVSDGIK